MKAGKRLGKARETVVQVFVAACTGSAKLSGEIGLPLVHIDVSIDPEASIRGLNAREHGAWVRAPKLFQPICFDGGWSDWSLFEYAPGPWPCASDATPEGVWTIEGRIFVSLPTGTPPLEFREQLHAALRHLRVHEVTSGMAYMAGRSSELADYVVHPRYTANAVGAGFRDARIVTDLYVLDPAEVPWSLFWIVVAARLVAIEGRRS